MRKSLVTFLFLTIFYSTIALAATNPDYGFHSFGEENTLKGDLSFSGIGQNDSRPSITHWHNARFQNVITGNQYPSGGTYIPTVQYDIQKKLETDDFSYRNGYHLMPLEESTVKRYAEYAGGNPEYVWNQIRSEEQKYLYRVDGELYVLLARVAFWAGGGDPDMREANGDGVNSPIFNTTYKTTPWPSIQRLSAKEGDTLDPQQVTENGEIYVQAKTHSVFMPLNSGWITVNDDPKTKTNVFIESKEVTKYTVNYDSTFSISKIAEHLKEGSNKLTLLVTDAFNRTFEQSITINYMPTNVNLKATNLWYSPESVKPGQTLGVTALITNESNQRIDTEVVIRKDGEEIGRQPLTLEANQAIRTEKFSFVAPNASSVKVDIEVNPDRDQPSTERIWTDNKTSLTIPLVSPNLKLSDVWYAPDKIKPTNKVTTSVLIVNEGVETVTTELIAKVDGKEIGKKNVTIEGEKSVRSPGFTFTAPDKPSVNVEYVVNPSKTMPSNESTYADNQLSRTVPIQQDKNLYILLRNLPNKVDSNKNFTFNVVVGNESNTAIKTKVTVRNNYKESVWECVERVQGVCVRYDWVTYNRVKDDNREITIPAHGEISYPLMMFSGWDYWDIGINKYYLTLTATVNPDRNPAETTYADNTKKVNIYVNPFEIPKTRGVLVQ